MYVRVLVLFGVMYTTLTKLMKVPEHTVEYEVGKGLKLILEAIAECEKAAEAALSGTGNDEKIYKSVGTGSDESASANRDL